MKKSILITMLLTFVGVTLFAQPRQGAKFQKFGKNQITAKLNLTPEQQKQFTDITVEHQKKMIDLNADVEKNQLEIKKMFVDKKIDEKELLDLTDANSKLQSQIKSSAVKKWINIYKILNDDQKELWIKHGAMMGAKMHSVRNAVKNRMQDRPGMQRPMRQRSYR